MNDSYNTTDNSIDDSFNTLFEDSFNEHHEDNDTHDTATPMPGSHNVDGYLCSGDPDHFSFSSLGGDVTEIDRLLMTSMKSQSISPFL